MIGRLLLCMGWLLGMAFGYFRCSKVSRGHWIPETLEEAVFCIGGVIIAVIVMVIVWAVLSLMAVVVLWILGPEEEEV